MQSTDFRAYPGLPRNKRTLKSSLKLSNQLYGTLHLLLCLLRNKKIRNNIDIYFTRLFAKKFVDTLLDLIKSYMLSLKNTNLENSNDNKNYKDKADKKKRVKKDEINLNKENLKLSWPNWISPFCVLLYELIISPIGLSEMKEMLVEVEKNNNEKNSEKEKEIENEQKRRTEDDEKNKNNHRKNNFLIDDSDEEKTENHVEEEKEDVKDFQAENYEINDIIENKQINKDKDERKQKVNEDENNGEDYKISKKSSEKGSEKDNLNEAELSLEFGNLLNTEVNRSSLLPEYSWRLIFETVFLIMKSSSTFCTLSSSKDGNVFNSRKKSFSPSNNMKNGDKNDTKNEYKNDNKSDYKNQKKNDNEDIKMNYKEEEKISFFQSISKNESKDLNVNENDSEFELQLESELKSELEINSHNFPEIRLLDPSSNQGILLLLYTLLSKRTLSTAFVQASGKYNSQLKHVTRLSILFTD